MLQCSRETAVFRLNCPKRRAPMCRNLAYFMRRTGFVKGAHMYLNGFSVIYIVPGRMNVDRALFPLKTLQLFTILQSSNVNKYPLARIKMNISLKR